MKIIRHRLKQGKVCKVLIAKGETVKFLTNENTVDDCEVLNKQPTWVYPHMIQISVSKRIPKGIASAQAKAIVKAELVKKELALAKKLKSCVVHIYSWTNIFTDTIPNTWIGIEACAFVAKKVMVRIIPKPWIPS